jgi:hypothetical protein
MSSSLKVHKTSVQREFDQCPEIRRLTIALQRDEQLVALFDDDILSFFTVIFFACHIKIVSPVVETLQKLL